MTIQEQIAASAASHGVPPSIALAVARRESNFNQAAIGAAGEVGTFQLMPATATYLGVNPYNLSQNIDGGVRYLREQYDRFGDWSLALAAYNAGPGNVNRGTIPTSTQRYVSDVLAMAGMPGAPSFSPPVPDPRYDSTPYSPYTTAGADFTVTGWGEVPLSGTVILLLALAAVVIVSASSA